jgi:hypothetical protein
MIPRKVFVGDQAKLVVPLGSASAGVSGGGAVSIVLDSGGVESVPEDRALELLDMKLERRSGAVFLVIDFQAYKTGRVELPPLAVDGRTLTGLAVEISSILEEGEGGRLLSPAAASIPVPGTVIMVYGFVFGLLVVIIASAFCTLYLIRSREDLLRRFRRKRAFHYTKKTIRRLGDELEKGGFSPERGGDLLAGISLALRNCLGSLLGINCLSLVPGEFLLLETGEGDGLYVRDKRAYLESFFSRSDALRFGLGIDKAKVSAMLEEALVFIGEFEHFKPPLQEGEAGAHGAGDLCRGEP